MKSPAAATQTLNGRPDRRVQVLEAAVRCVVKHGYDSVRLKDVARECGVSIGLLQHHFDTREELLEQALARASDTLIERWSAAVAAEPDPWRRIVVLIDQLSDDPDLRGHCIGWVEFCLVAARQPGPAASVQRVFTAWRDNVEDAVRAGIDSGAFTPRLDVEDAVDVLLALVDGFELSIVARTDRMDGARLRELVLSTARITLGARGAEPAA